MNFHPDDPRLTAYLLGELSADEAAEVVRAAAADPAIGLALQDLQGIQSFLTNTLAPATAELLPHQRASVVRAARQLDLTAHAVPLASLRRSWKPFLIPVAAAALVVLATLVFLNPPVDSPPGLVKLDPSTWEKEVPLEIALLPAPGPVDPRTGNGSSQGTGAASGRLAEQAAARDSALATTGEDFLRKVAERLRQTPAPPPNALPTINPRDSVSAITDPVLPLPIHAGRASLTWINHAVRTEHQLPSANAVRLEEILNHFNLRPVGGAGVSQGVSITTEATPCPWKPSATLLLVAVRGAQDAAHDVKASFHADPASVSLYRLLGFAPVVGLPAGQLPSRLPAKTTTTLVIEIEPAAFTAPLGTIEWSVDGKPAAAIPVSRQAESEPSTDSRFGSLVCAYAQWLAHDHPSLIDADLVAALARECASPGLPADRQDFIALIGQSLALKR